jgi:hypothetical protein
VKCRPLKGRSCLAAIMPVPLSRPASFYPTSAVLPFATEPEMPMIELTEWQDIQSAPRCGMDILLWLPACPSLTDEARDNHAVVGGWYASECGEVWHDTNALSWSAFKVLWPHPTYWMPLPPRP